MGSIRDEILDNWCYLCRTGLGCEHTKKEANTEVNAEEWLDSGSENLYEAEDIIKSQLNRITELEQENQRSLDEVKHLKDELAAMYEAQAGADI